MLGCEASSHNLFKSLLSPLPGTNQYWCHMENRGHDQCEVQTHDPEVVRQTPVLTIRPNLIKLAVYNNIYIT